MRLPFILLSIAAFAATVTVGRHMLTPNDEVIISDGIIIAFITILGTIVTLLLKHFLKSRRKPKCQCGCE